MDPALDLRFPRFKGTPEGYRRVGFRLPDGRAVVVVAKIPEDWDVGVFVEGDTHRTFCVSSSPDKEGLCVTRWLADHGPCDVAYATAAEQRAALNGKDAATATLQELAEEAMPLITSGDAPVPIAPWPIVLMPAQPDEAQPDLNGRARPPRRRDYAFRQQRMGPAVNNTRLVLDCHTDPSLTLVTKSVEASLLGAFRNGSTEMYFLFDDGADYLVECIRMRYYRSRRLEVRSPKGSHGGQTPQQVVEALAPTVS